MFFKSNQFRKQYASNQSSAGLGFAFLITISAPGPPKNCSRDFLGTARGKKKQGDCPNSCNYYPLETGLERITFLCVGVLTNEIKQHLIFFFIAILEVKEVNKHFICQIPGKNWTKGANWGQLVIDFLVFLILKEDKECLKV